MTKEELIKRIEDRIIELSIYNSNIHKAQRNQCQWILNDLTSLQEQTEREVEIKEKGENKMTFTTVFNCSGCGGRIYGGSTTKYCPGCGAKIKRVD